MGTAPEVGLVTSYYAAEEARRNLRTAKQQNDLEKLLAPVEIVGSALKPEDYPALEGVSLPEKDRPTYSQLRVRGQRIS